MITAGRVALALAALIAAAAGGARLALKIQAGIARRAIGKPFGEEAHRADRTYRKKHGDPVLLLLLGDSIAAGLGAAHRRETLGAHLSRRLAKKVKRAVTLHTAARVGSETSMLRTQISTLPPTYRPDVAVIVIGGNDVIHRIAVSESVSHLREAIEALQQRGAAVVVGTCPNLGTLTAVPQPLRSVIGALSRQLAAAQTETVVALGATPVSLATSVGPFFVAEPDVMFSEDRFHPSGAGYRRAAKALLPAVAEAVLDGAAAGQP